MFLDHSRNPGIDRVSALNGAGYDTTHAYDNIISYDCPLQHIYLSAKSHMISDTYVFSLIDSFVVFDRQY